MIKNTSHTKRTLKFYIEHSNRVCILFRQQRYTLIFSALFRSPDAVIVTPPPPSLHPPPHSARQYPSCDKAFGEPPLYCCTDSYKKVLEAHLVEAVAKITNSYEVTVQMFHFPLKRLEAPPL